MTLRLTQVGNKTSVWQKKKLHREDHTIRDLWEGGGQFACDNEHSVEATMLGSMENECGS